MTKLDEMGSRSLLTLDSVARCLRQSNAEHLLVRKGGLKVLLLFKVAIFAAHGISC